MPCSMATKIVGEVYCIFIGEVGPYEQRTGGIYRVPERLSTFEELGVQGVAAFTFCVHRQLFAFRNWQCIVAVTLAQFNMYFSE